MEWLTKGLFDQHGILALGWVLLLIVVPVQAAFVLWLIKRFFSELQIARNLSDQRSAAYQEVVKNNTESITAMRVLFEERTRRK